MPVLQLTGDAAGAVKAISDVDAATNRLTNTFKTTGATTEQLAKQLQQAYNETPIDNYIRKCEEMAKKVAAGTMSVDQYKAATDRLSGGLKETGDAQGKAFGSEAIANIATMATETFGFVEIIKTGTQALHDMAEERKRLAEQSATGLVAAGQLSAAGGTEADLQEARDIQARGITQGDDQSIRTLTGFVRAGLGRKDRDYIENLGEQKLIDPNNLGQYPQELQAFQRSFGDKADSFQNTEKMIRKAGYDTRFDPGELALAATRLGKPAADNGFSEAQAIAMLAVMANKTRNLRTAGGDVEKMITDGNTFEGADAVAYAKELQGIQGAPGEAGKQSLAFTDPELSASLSAEESKAQRAAFIKRQSATREQLFTALSTARQTHTIETEGEFFGGIDAYFQEKMDRRGTMFGMIPSVDSLPFLENRNIREAAKNEGDYLPKALIERMNSYLESLDNHAQKQTTIMERSDRSLPPPSGLQE